jgi:hypothetical protein
MINYIVKKIDDINMRKYTDEIMISETNQTHFIIKMVVCGIESVHEISFRSP